MVKTLLFFLFSIPLVASASSEPTKSPDENDSSIVSDENSVSFFDTAGVYINDWDNHVTFRYPEAGFSPEGTIPLVDSEFGYAFPLEKETTSGFGGRRRHKGIDIPLETGENIVAAFGGKVRYAKWNTGGFGNLVIIRHPNGLETYYAHLSKIKVKPNQIVQTGELIGLGGSTGRSYSPHLHFEVRYGHVAFDPKHIFDLENYCLKTETLNLDEVIDRGKGKLCKESAPHNEKECDHDHGHNSKAEKVTNDGETRYHTVKSGDTLSKIGIKHGSSIDSLCELNGLTRSSILQIGQKIRVK